MPVLQRVGVRMKAAARVITHAFVLLVGGHVHVDRACVYCRDLFEIFFQHVCSSHCEGLGATDAEHRLNLRVRDGFVQYSRFNAWFGLRTHCHDRAMS